MSEIQKLSKKINSIESDLELLDTDHPYFISEIEICAHVTKVNRIGSVWRKNSKIVLSKEALDVILPHVRETLKRRLANAKAELKELL